MEGTVEPVLVSVSIDTEEDDWGRYEVTGASVRNIRSVPRLQALMDRWGVRPTYLVNRPPLLDRESVGVLGRLAERPDVEIGTHCHPWNTPPQRGGGVGDSMMCGAPAELNLERIRSVTESLRSELGVEPECFRAGRWGFGPTVAAPLAQLGYRVDASVSPFVDWSKHGGPDNSAAPWYPYRFEPDRPLVPVPDGGLIQLPVTIGFLRGRHPAANRVRSRLERSWWARLRVVGALDRMGVLARRWLSPETSSAEEMVRLARAWVRSGEWHLGLTFHSCTLLPGATPFVADVRELERFLASLDRFFGFCREQGYRFATLREVADRFESGRSSGPGRATA